MSRRDEYDRRFQSREEWRPTARAASRDTRVIVTGHRQKDARHGGKLSRGIKGKDYGFALIGHERERHLQDDLRNQLASSSTPLETTSTPSSTQPMSAVTPRMIVEEIQRSGHFDRLRKQLFTTFQASGEKAALTNDLQTYLLDQLEDLPTNERQRLARQDARLQHSELERWLEERSEPAKVVEAVLARLRCGEGPGRESERGDSERGAEASIRAGTLFAANDGDLYAGLEARLRETIESKRRPHAASESADTSVHGDTPGAAAATGSGSGTGTGTGATPGGSGGHSDAGSVTPNTIRSNVTTPLRHEVPQEQ